MKYQLPYASKTTYWKMPQYSIEIYQLMFGKHNSKKFWNTLLLSNTSRRFQKNGLLQSWGSEAAGRHNSCQMASCNRGFSLLDRARHAHLRHRHLGRWLPGGEQALGPLGVRPRHNGHLCLANVGRYWQVDRWCELQSKDGVKRWNHSHRVDTFVIHSWSKIVAHFQDSRW